MALVYRNGSLPLNCVYRNGSLALRFPLQRTIVIRKWLEFWLELLTIDYDLPLTQLFFAMKISKFWIFFEFLVFFKLYFGHVPDCTLLWKIVIFFDACRILRKIFKPIRRVLVVVFKAPMSTWLTWYSGSRREVCFGTPSMCVQGPRGHRNVFLGVNISSQKSCSCKKMTNMRYAGKCSDTKVDWSMSGSDR